jgi:hypothetical protein
MSADPEGGQALPAIAARSTSKQAPAPLSDRRPRPLTFSRYGTPDRPQRRLQGGYFYVIRVLAQRAPK